MSILLSLAIMNASALYGVDPRLLRAIAHVESSSGHNSKLRKNTNGTYDVGPFQINSVHWTTTCRRLDVSTLQGNAGCAALLLSRIPKRDPNWYGAYHSKTPSLKLKYANKIKVFLKQTDKK